MKNDKQNQGGERSMKNSEGKKINNEEGTKKCLMKQASGFSNIAFRGKNWGNWIFKKIKHTNKYFS